MKIILVPTDGSAAAEKATNLALDLAQHHGAEIKLLHVLLRDKEPDELLRLPGVSSADEEIVSKLNSLKQGPAIELSAEKLMAFAVKRPVSEKVLRLIGDHVLKRAKAQALERDVSVEVLELTDGPPAAAIVAAADKIDADTIIMGMRGLRQIEAMTFGSVSQEVCRTTLRTCVAVH